MRALLPGLLVCLLYPALGQATPVRNVTAADAPRALEGDGPVQVRWDDPAKFTEIAFSGNRWEAARGNWVQELAQHLAEQAGPRLQPGQRLQVTFTDIDLAGDYEPWRGPRMSDVRLLRELYPPKISLSYQLSEAGGQLLHSAEQVLSDPGFLHSGGSLRYRNDSLRYEKRLLDRWLQQLLPAAPAAARR